MEQVKHYFSIAFVVLVTSLVATGCTTLKPYEKEYIVNPAMDDASQGRLKSGMNRNARSRYEKFTASGAGGAAVSCPTCGG